VRRGWHQKRTPSNNGAILEAPSGATMLRDFWLVIPMLASTLLPAQTLSKADIREADAEVGAVIDDWHLAAAQSDEPRYLSHMAPDMVFIGFDQKERWDGDEFRKWIHAVFVNHAIWQFKANHRNIHLSKGGDTAWFDEIVELSSTDTGRGTGVLVKHDKTWLIAQYALSLPVPRQVLGEVLSVIRSQKDAEKDLAKPGKPVNQGK
jgi:ketosteroid isomerase-like protein